MGSDPLGILLIDKPEGMTSHDVVACIRKKGSFNKVGHTGTLDPLATGLLVLLIGGATRRAGLFLQDEKSYEAKMTLGLSTETGDCEGKPIQYGPYEHVRLEEVVEVFKTLQGAIDQVPPMYSAVKQGGQKLYELARKGLSVERAPRKVTIRVLELRAFHLPTLSFVLTCSKGTYVRTLVETIGEKLGCPSHLSSLRRTQAGPFSVTEAISIEKALMLDREALLNCLQSFR